MSLTKGKLIVIFLAVILIIAGVLWFFKDNTNQPLNSTPVSYNFAGNLVSMSSDQIAVEGGYKDMNGKALSADTKSVRMSLAPSTKIIRVVVHLPSEKELKESNGIVNGSDLEREEMPGSMEKLKSDMENGFYGINIFAKSVSNIFGRDAFEASEIKYETAE